MDLKELGRKCAAAGLKDVAAYVTMMVKPLSDAVFPSIKSTESICSQAFASHLASVHSTEELHRSGCVLQRLWLRMLGFRNRNENRATSIAEQPVQQSQKKKKD